MKRIKIRLHFLAERPQCFKSGFETQDEGTVANNIGRGRGGVGDAPRTNVTKLMSSMTKSTPAFFDPMRTALPVPLNVQPARMYLWCLTARRASTFIVRTPIIVIEFEYFGGHCDRCDKF